jgi:hypothetical protein
MALSPARAGIAIYLRFTRAIDRTGDLALRSLLGLLAVLYLGSVLGPPPPNERALAFSALGIWFTVPWASWTDQHPRSARQEFVAG